MCHRRGIVLGKRWILSFSFIFILSSVTLILVSGCQLKTCFTRNRRIDDVSKSPFSPGVNKIVKFSQEKSQSVKWSQHTNIVFILSSNRLEALEFFYTFNKRSINIENIINLFLRKILKAFSIETDPLGVNDASVFSSEAIKLCFFRQKVVELKWR